MINRGAYVHNPMAKFSGVAQNVQVLQILKMLMVSDKIINKDFRIHKTTHIFKQNPLENGLIFTIYQNYTLAFSLLLMH